MLKKDKKPTSCDDCMYFEWDEELEENFCTQSSLDEDDYARIIGDSHYSCPFYRTGNEYTIVKKQI